MHEQHLLFSFEATEESALPALVKKIKAEIQPDSVLLLSGEVAAGKTTFARVFCDTYGLKMVQSPTYAIHQRYVSSQVTIDHLDLYRLDSEEQIETAGLWDLLQERGNLLLIEWSEKLTSDWLPLNRNVYKLQISLHDSGLREYNFFKMN